MPTMSSLNISIRTLLLMFIHFFTVLYIYYKFTRINNFYKQITVFDCKQLMNIIKRNRHSNAHKHNRHIDIKRIGINKTDTYKSLARIASHLFLKLANVPIVFAIYFSVSNLIFTFLRKLLKSGRLPALLPFPNKQFSGES